jgi:hypothetical protein
MQTVSLEEQDWTQVMGILSEAPWRIANPLLMKIGGQLRVQQETRDMSGPPNRPARADGNSKEVHDE